MDLHKKFKTIAYLEGISFLVLLGIAMPMKYVYGNPLPVRLVGWIHGLLFIAYIILLNQISTEKKWPFKKKFLGVVAGITPFGPFIFAK